MHTCRQGHFRLCLIDLLGRNTCLSNLHTLSEREERPCVALPPSPPPSSALSEVELSAAELAALETDACSIEFSRKRYLSTRSPHTVMKVKRSLGFTMKRCLWLPVYVSRKANTAYIVALNAKIFCSLRTPHENIRVLKSELRIRFALAAQINFVSLLFVKYFRLCYFVSNLEVGADL